MRTRVKCPENVPPDDTRPPQGSPPRPPGIFQLRTPGCGVILTSRGSSIQADTHQTPCPTSPPPAAQF